MQLALNRVCLTDVLELLAEYEFHRQPSTRIRRTLADPVLFESVF